ncbi:HpcH/HpaI aldolase family protein [Sulfitobacter pacificus]|uniref:HpcH/HpaI aldolase family protein n=1 Tax=Sulfitobacter pacificus TaxID=1499314 RepID=UPI00333F3815
MPDPETPIRKNPKMTFHHRLKQGMPQLATFVKTPHPMVIEVLGGTDLDALILDCEHSPFGMADIDRAILAARAVGKPILARLPNDQFSSFLKVMDMGAEGIVVPHVSTAQKARDIVQALHYGNGGRGFATTTRAGDYGRVGMKDHLLANADPTILVQIEDPAAVDNIDDIVAVPGISGVFLGPADLAVSYGVNDPTGPRVVDAMTKVITAARKAALPVVCFASSPDIAKSLYARGVTLVVLASEHTAIQNFFSAEAVAHLRC